MQRSLAGQLQQLLVVGERRLGDSFFDGIKRRAGRDDREPHDAGAADVDVELALEPFGDRSPARRPASMSECGSIVRDCEPPLAPGDPEADGLAGAVGEAGVGDRLAAAGVEEPCDLIAALVPGPAERRAPVDVVADFGSTPRASNSSTVEARSNCTAKWSGVTFRYGRPSTSRQPPRTCNSRHNVSRLPDCNDQAGALMLPSVRQAPRPRPLRRPCSGSSPVSTFSNTWLRPPSALAHGVPQHGGAALAVLARIPGAGLINRWNRAASR